MIEQDQTLTKVNRPGLFNCYLRRMSDYLSRANGISYEDAERFVKGIVKSKYKPKELIYVKAIGPGRTQICKSDFYKFIRELNDKVISPCGGIYYPTAERPSPVSEFLSYKKKQRSKVKKDQLKALQRGDDREANRFWYLQASIKILMNSCPGAYGSPYSLFYDKNCYNVITSTGRSEVRQNTSMVEQMLGGEFAWWSENELINWILGNIENMPNKENVEYVLTKYNMKHVTSDQVYEYLKSNFTKYTRDTDYFEVKELLNKLSQIELDFIFYYCNLRNIIQYNDDSFRPIIKGMLDPKSYFPIDGTADDVYKVPEPVQVLVAVAFTDILQGKCVDDIAKKNTELIPTFLGIAKGIKKKLDEFDEVFHAFCWTWFGIPNIYQRGQFAMRNTVVLQDTDSAMFSTKYWADWYSQRTKFNIDNDSLAITELCVYWLFYSSKFAMYRFSVKHGITTPYLSTLSFKSEYLYPSFLLSSVKKTYAATMAVKEGVVLNPYKIDIKGQTLRGSSKSEDVNEFIEDLIKNKILLPSAKGKISAYDLIEAVVNFEIRMKDSLLRGETTFLSTDSIKLDKDYKNVNQPILLGYKFWEELMAKKYGSITRPAKVISFSCLYPSQDYLGWLNSNYPQFCKKLENYLSSGVRFPSKIVVNPALDRVPPEIVPLIHVKHIVNLNCKPIYSLLSRLNINCGNPDSNILFSELYSNDDRLSLGQL